MRPVPPAPPLESGHEHQHARATMAGPDINEEQNRAERPSFERPDEDELEQLARRQRIVRGVVNLYERAQVRLFVRRDPFRRFYSCLAYVPRDRYNTQARKRIERLALDAFRGVAIDSQVTLSESVLARVHMLVRTRPDTDASVDAAELERRITQTVRTWQDRL